MARTAAKKSTARRRPAAKKTAPARRPAPAVTTASSGGVADLAGGLKTLLGAVEGEVRSVSSLSEKIDDLVAKLNAARAEQAQRLTALDALKSSAEDGGLSTFLDKLIRPRMPRVPENIPARLKRS